MHLRPMSFQATLIFVICSWSPVPWLRKQEESKTVIRPNADSISKYIGQQRSLVADSFGKFIWKHRLPLRNGLRTLGMPVRCTCILCYSRLVTYFFSACEYRCLIAVSCPYELCDCVKWATGFLLHMSRVVVKLLLFVSVDVEPNLGSDTALVAQARRI